MIKVFDSYKNKKWSGRKFKPNGNSLLMYKGSIVTQDIILSPGKYSLKILAKKNAGNGKIKVVMTGNNDVSLINKEVIPSSSWTEFNFPIEVSTKNKCVFNMHRLFANAFGTTEVGRVVVLGEENLDSVAVSPRKAERDKRNVRNDSNNDILFKKVKYKRTIGFVIPYGIYGGAEVYIKNLINNMDDEYNIQIIYNRPNMLKNKINHKALHTDVSTRPHLEGLLCSLELDYIVYYNSISIYKTLIALKETGRIKSKLIEIYHSDFTWPDAISNIRSRERVELILKIAPSLCSDIQNIKQEILPVGIDIKKFLSAKPKNIINKGNGLVFGTVARLSPEKNIDYILDLAKARSNDIFVIAGDGPLKNSLSSKATDNVKFIGFVPAIESIYKEFDAFILPSNMEGMPISIIESMASGCPVFCSNVGSISDFIVDSSNATFLSMNAEYDCNLIENVMSNQDAIIEMKDNALDLVNNNFDIIKCTNKFKECIRMIDNFFIKNDKDDMLFLQGEFL